MSYSKLAETLLFVVESPITALFLSVYFFQSVVAFVKELLSAYLLD